MGLWIRTTIPPVGARTKRVLGIMAIWAAVAIVGQITGLPDIFIGGVAGWLSAEMWRAPWPHDDSR